MTEQTPDQDRRGFLARAWKLLGTVAALQFVGVVAAFVWPRKPEGSEGAVVEAGPVGEFTPSSVTAFPQGRFYLVRLTDGGFLALSSKCPHLGCTVPWNEKEKTFPCPCHASVFDIRGEVLSPPAPRPLDRLKVTIDSGIVRVDTAQRIQRARVEPSDVTYL